MKKISFVQPNFNQGPVEYNIFYLPYTAGVLWAYVNQFEDIKNKYSFGEFVWRRDNIDSVVERLKDHAVVGFSTYIWNRKYNYSLAEKLKRANPDCLIVFGGPEVPVEQSNIFQQYPFMDVVIKQEGEHSFYKVLQGDLEYPGLLVNRNGACVDTGPSIRITDLDVVVSPYLSGVFDHLLEQHPEVIWNGTIETNRGCPYACTFCDWGSLTYAKVKKYDLERTFAEIEWFGKNKIEWVSITDANFGIFPDRDIQIANHFVKQKQTQGYPKDLQISWAKNQKQSVVDIVLAMIDGGFTDGLNVSVQTLDEQTLENIKRKNLAMNKVEDIFSICTRKNIPMYTELILGLPGETLRSWQQNFYKLYQAGNHTGISVYQCQLLENAELQLIQKDQYNITSVEVADYFEGGYYDDDCIESNSIVTSTKDMPLEDMIHAYMFTWFQKTFHINGVTNYIARFLSKHCAVEYEDFYTKLQQDLLQDSWLASEYTRVEHSVRQWYTTGAMDKYFIGNIPVNAINLSLSTLFKIHADDKINHVFGLLQKHLKFYYPDSVQYHKSLLDFQKHSIIQYTNFDQYPMHVRSDFDFLGYIIEDSDLDCAVDYQFVNTNPGTVSASVFLERIYFKRRSGYGKAKITVDKSIKDAILVE